MAVDRKLLAQALGQNKPTSSGNPQQSLATGQSISQFAMNSANFGSGQARGIGLAAQLATAGVGAYTQYKAQKDINEQEIASRSQFIKNFPHLADIAPTLSKETLQAYTLESLKNTLKADDPSVQLDLQGKRLDIQGKQVDIQGKELGLRKTQAEIGKLNAEAGNAGKPDVDKIFKNATALRSDYLANSKDFMQVRNGYERVLESSKNPSPAGDLALIFAFMKTQDPTSVVRESEFATAAKAGSFGDRIQAAVSRVESGKRLSSDQRTDFVSRAKSFYDRSEKTQKKTADQYTAIAERNNINPQDVVVDFNTSIEKAPEQTLDPNVFGDIGDDAISQEIARRRGQK